MYARVYIYIIYIYIYIEAQDIGRLTDFRKYMLKPGGCQNCILKIWKSNFSSSNKHMNIPLGCRLQVQAAGT